MLRRAGDRRTSILIERVHIGAALREPPRQIGMAAPDRGREAAIEIARKLDERLGGGRALCDCSQERRYVLVVARVVIGAGCKQGIEHRHIAARRGEPKRCPSEIIAGVEIGA